jgi:hypothetical protein
MAQRCYILERLARASGHESSWIRTSDLIQKFAAELSASFASRCVFVVLVGQGRQCLLHPCEKQTVAR